MIGREVALSRSARLHRLELPLPLQLRRINIYLVEGPDGLALVDTGMDTPAGRDALDRGLRRLGARPERIDQVFITHFHLDHFGQAARLQRCGARGLMPRVDGEQLQRWFHDPELDREALGFFRTLGVPNSTLERMAGAMAQMRAANTPFAADRLVDGSGTVELAGIPFEAIETPGHSPGHLCLHHPPSGVLLVGDHVLPHITPNISITRDAPVDPLGDYRRSLAEVRARGFTGLALPAHGPAMERLDARIDEILEHHRQREALVLELMGSRATSCYSLAERLFETGSLDGWETWMATGETLAHLRALEVEGRVERTDDGLFRVRT